MKNFNDTREDFWPRLWVTFMPEPTSLNMMGLVGRGLLWLGLVAYSISLLGGIHPDKGQWLHLVNLPFHEAGHIVFGFAHPLITSIGGTLMQLLIPLTCAGVLLLRQQDGFGAAVALWWFGENFIDIAPYIKDASVGELPLLGGNVGKEAPYGFHDWEFILTETGLIAHDAKLALFSYLLGCSIMLVTLIWAALQLWYYLKLYQEQ